MKMTVGAIALGIWAAWAMQAQAATLREATADMVDNNGKKIGAARLREGAHGIVMDVKAKGLTPGVHGVHFHSVGDCSDHTHFKAAGGHVASDEGVEHGLLNEKGFHEGDLPNLYADKDGVAQAQFFTSRVTLGHTDRPQLLDEDGSALMIHARGDDHQTQPSGDSGDRVACGVLRAVKGK